MTSPIAITGSAGGQQAPVSYSLANLLSGSGYIYNITPTIISRISPANSWGAVWPAGITGSRNFILTSREEFAVAAGYDFAEMGVWSGSVTTDSELQWNGIGFMYRYGVANIMITGGFALPDITKTASTIFTMSYDSLVYRFYKDNTLLYGYSASNAMWVNPFFALYHPSSSITYYSYGQLTGSIIPAVTAVTSSARLKTASPVQTGGGTGPTSSYSLTPWWTASVQNWVLDSTTCAVNSTTGGTQPGAIGNVSTIYSTNVKLSAQVIQVFIGMEQRMGLGSVAGGVDANPRYNWVVYPGLAPNTITARYHDGGQGTILFTTRSAANTTTVFTVAFDGEVVRWYMDDVQKASVSASTYPPYEAGNFLPVFKGAGSLESPYGGWKNISYTQLSGTPIPLLPQSVIRFV